MPILLFSYLEFNEIDVGIALSLHRSRISECMILGAAAEEISWLRHTGEEQKLTIAVI